jgi:hypothetical protein
MKWQSLPDVSRQAVPSATLNEFLCKCDSRTCCSVAAETSEKEGQVAEPDLLGAPDDPWWGPQQAPSFPEFRHNNQLSYPLIYSYLASTEDQVSALLWNAVGAIIETLLVTESVNFAITLHARSNEKCTQKLI